MPLPDAFKGRLRLPVIAAPMFLVSGPDLVIAACKAGVIGAFPSLNARPEPVLDEWLDRIDRELAAHDAAHPDRPAAPYAMNLIVHRSNPRLPPDLAVCLKRRVPLVITSVGNPTEIVKQVKDYGGVVFHDVIGVKQAEVAIRAGVDGLILVCAGAGGHGGTQNPFALVPQIREIWDGPVALSGTISDGRSIRAAEVLGADLAYIGTRFIATKEANARDAYKGMIVDSSADDIVFSDAFDGIKANMLRPSILQAGLDPDHLSDGTGPDLRKLAGDEAARAWRDVWSAGQGVGSIHDVPDVARLIDRLEAEYRAARAA